jgi:hypothetical protein
MYICCALAGTIKDSVSQNARCNSGGGGGTICHSVRYISTHDGVRWQILICNEGASEQMWHARSPIFHLDEILYTGHIKCVIIWVPNKQIGCLLRYALHKDMTTFVCFTTFEWITRPSNLEFNLKFTVVSELIQHSSSIHQYQIRKSSQFPVSQKQVIWLRISGSYSVHVCMKTVPKLKF